MIPRVWTDSTAPDLPYSIEAPVVERLLRHSGRHSGKQLIQLWLICTGIANGAIYALLQLPPSILDGVLLIGWGITLMVILGAAYLGATISGMQVRSQSYQLLWMTGLSDHALASSLLIATLHRMRMGIVIMIGIMPLLVYGMSAQHTYWAVETTDCPITWQLAWCREQSPPVQALASSGILGFSLWLSLVTLLPVGAMVGVWLGMRWRQASLAASTAVGLMGMILLILGTLGLWAVDTTPPLRESLIWSAEIALFSALMLIVSIAVLIWRDGLLRDDGMTTLLLVLGGIATLGWGLGFYIAYPVTRSPLLNIFGVLVIPYGMLVVGLHVFWRGARTQFED